MSPDLNLDDPLGDFDLRAITLDFILDYAEDQARTQARGSRLAVAGLWAQCKDEVSALIRESEGLYLDPKQTLLAAFALLENYALKATKTV